MLRRWLITTVSGVLPRGTWESCWRPALCSTLCPNSHYRGKKVNQRYPSGDAFAQNELLLLNALAQSVVHRARVPLEDATNQGWGLMRCGSGYYVWLLGCWCTATR